MTKEQNLLLYFHFKKNTKQNTKKQHEVVVLRGREKTQ